ncbi:hypothetical protein CJ306_21470 [Bacillus cereus]|nr:hypothetical protein CJ306_21470 [Bacillus cereus]
MNIPPLLDSLLSYGKRNMDERVQERICKKIGELLRMLECENCDFRFCHETKWDTCSSEASIDIES